HSDRGGGRRRGACCRSAAVAGARFRRLRRGRGRIDRCGLPRAAAEAARDRPQQRSDDQRLAARLRARRRRSGGEARARARRHRRPRYGNWVARMTATDHPSLVRGVVIAAAAAKQYAPELSKAVTEAGDPSLPKEARLAALRFAFFAPGSDPTVW